MRKLSSTMSVLLLISVINGCSPNPVIHQGAAQGAQITVDLGGEYKRVIEAQDALYQARMRNVVLSVNELYNELQRLRTIQEGRKFSKINANGQVTADEVTQFMSASMQTWSKRHSDYAALLARARTTFEKNRKKIEADESKLRALRAKFIALSDTKGRAESIRFLVAFAKEVRTEIDKQTPEEGDAGGGS